MKWLLRGLVVVVVGFTVLSYTIYSLDYKGNYNLTVESEILMSNTWGSSGTGTTTWAIEDVEAKHQGTGVFDWLLGGGSNDDLSGAKNSVRVSLKSSSAEYIGVQNFEIPSYAYIDGADPIPVPVTFKNIEPGNYLVTIELLYYYTSETVLSSKYVDLEVGE